MSKPDDIPQDVRDRAANEIAAHSAKAADIEPGKRLTYIVARAIMAAKAEEQTRYRGAIAHLKTKIDAERAERGRAKSALHLAEQRERQLAVELGRWKVRAQAAEARLHSIGEVNTAY